MAALQLIDEIVRGLTYPVAGAIFLNQLDDLFVDLGYFARGLHRRERRVVPGEALRDVEQKRIAVMVPAWMEADVIGDMLAHNRADVDFDRGRWDVFCGTYANDPETQARVDAAARRDRGIHKVVVPHDGPTCKADCLNWVYQGVVQEEQRRGFRYDILLMHDAEDVIHPLALRLYSLLIPAHDFVQTPVFSLELPPWDAVAGTYIDEFGEHHLKDMRVREALGGLVPSAGVGSAFERCAFAEIAAQNGQRPFDVTSLTEDYEIGLKFRLAGKKICFACRTVEREVEEERGLLRRRPVRVRREEYIATREYFPAQLGASIRQRSRWILGITLQAWESVGWQGPAAVRYCLWRDRKGLLNAGLVVLAYLVVLHVLLRELAGIAQATPGGPGPLVVPGSVLAVVLTVNLAGMLWRAALKVYFVSELYGLLQGLLAVPRLFLANVIGIAATARAVRTWVGHRRTGEPLRWLKTAHVYPSVEALAARRRRLGDLLVEREALATKDLDAALDLQHEVELPLGELLAITGALPERRVVRGLAAQYEMKVCRPDPARISRELLQCLPEADAEALGVLPCRREGDLASVAVSRPLAPRERAALEARLSARLELELAEPRRLERARAIAYRRVHPLSPGGAMLGEQLVAQGRLAPGELDWLLDEQLETGEQLGELLLRSRTVSQEELGQVFAGDGGFAAVGPGDADAGAVARLEHPFCALHGLVPLRRTNGSRIVAASYPLHPQVAAAVAERLGEEVHVVAAGSLSVRVALGIALVAGGRAGAGGRPGGARPGPAPGGGPRGPAAAEGALPPGLARESGIAVVRASTGALVLAAPSPTAGLARRVSRLMPGWRIAWEQATEA